MSTNVLIPTVGESIKTVIVAKWLVAAGQAVKKGDGVLEIDSDKASMEVPAPVDGVLTERLAAEGEEVAIGSVVARITEGAASAVVIAEPKAEEKPKSGAKAGPAVRQAADQAGISLDGVEGSGKRGQITRGDLPKPGAAALAAIPEPATPVATRVAEPGRVQRVPMTPLRRTIARRLVEVNTTTAMLTTFNEIDMSAVMALRKRYQDGFVAKYGIKLGFMSFFAKAAIDALKEFPAVNAEIQGTDFLYKSYYNLGVAVSAPKGLVVPVLRDADRLSFAETEKGIAELGSRAKGNKLLPVDFEDGTFTITNGGIFGSLMSTPILNPPQVGILGMHNIVERPVARDGQVVIRPMMYVALSYDHRIIDGREAVGFLVRIKDCIEAPDRMLLEV